MCESTLKVRSVSRNDAEYVQNFEQGSNSIVYMG